MKRIIDHFLVEWKTRVNRKPLLLRGARQVGKTHAARALGATFPVFVEFNLEDDDAARRIVEKDLDPHRMLLQLSELVQVKITPGSTLLFFDEIQAVPNAITALRYFYEKIPDLHVIAAGSLLDFAIEQVGIPVGRVSSLYMYPLSFLEFLVAVGNVGWAKTIIERQPGEAMSDPLHEKLVSLVGEYVAIGGMPEAVNEWIREKASRAAKIVHADLLFNYRQDFGKYAKRHQIKYLYRLFQKAVEQIGKKFIFSRVGEYQKRELEPALELLEKAGIVYPVTQSAGQGIPIGAQADMDDFKIVLLDVGLSQALLRLDIAPWFIDPIATFINKGEIVEAFVGQEILAYSDPIAKEELFYWRRNSRGSCAEVDYLVQIKENVVPIEVKAGTSARIRSMHMFLDSHPNSKYGIRFSAYNYAIDQRIYSYPLYAVAKVFLDANENMRLALENLVKP